MILMLILLSAVLILCVYLLLYRQRNFPPGPLGYPFLGNIPELKRLSKALGGSHLAYSELAKRCKTKVLGLKLGENRVVVVFSYPLVRTVLTAEEYEGRPDSFFIRLRSMGTRKGVTCTDGELWKIQRAFISRHLRSLGFGKKPMELKIKEELQEVLNRIRDAEEEIQMGNLLAPAVINVLWGLTTGARIQHGDIRLRKLLDLLKKRTKVFDMSGGTLTQFPWLRFLFPERTGYKLLLGLNDELRQFFLEIIDEHESSWTADRNDDLIYSFLTEMAKDCDKETTFTKDQLMMICLDLFIGGSQTTSNTLDFAFLMMLLHPNVLEKVQRELDTILSPNEELEYIHRFKLPYVEATLQEVNRFCNVVPVRGPRRVQWDTSLDGHFIPKDATVIASLHSVHMDPEYWGDPEVFRPERFLNEEGKLITDDRVLAFGLGRRRCLGEVLARSCIFIFFTGILREFTFCPAEKLPNATPVPGITLSPPPYKVKFMCRVKQ